MPYDIRIIRSRDFIRLDAQGHVDLPTSRKLFSDVIWSCVHGRIGRVLIDVRDATTEMTAAQLCSLADVCRGITPPDDQHRIAILNRPPLEFDRSAALAKMAQDAGWNIKAFRDFEQAFTWLIS